MPILTITDNNPLFLCLLLKNLFPCVHKEGGFSLYSSEEIRNIRYPTPT